jgi:parallel beta-helix repeat protein
LQQPYRTAAYLLAHIGPGQTGCLLGGTFAESLSVSTGGAVGSPKRLASAPGFRATLRGVLSISDSANDLVFENLVLDGQNGNATPSPQVNGDRVTFRGDEVTNENSGICFMLGGSFEDYGRARDVVIERNRIHDCGRLPVTGHDHGIYVEGADNAQITDNYIYANADWGIQLYPDSDGSYIAYNVIDGNGAGLIFAGEHAGGEYQHDYASDNNTVERNIISNSTVGYNVESWWGGPTGTGNVAGLNCLWNGHLGDVDGSNGGFVAYDNTIADPLYVNRLGFDFRLLPGSICVGGGPR